MATHDVDAGALQVAAADGRRLAVQEFGYPAGYPVFLLHGTPGGRLGPAPKTSRLYQLGVRLVSFDRPGYGLSDSNPGRSVADVAADVKSIADKLGIDEFSVLGRSGGGPHALACAALLPDRVRRAAALVSLAPFDAEGLDWFSGMSESNVSAYTDAASAPEELSGQFGAAATRIRADPLSHFATIAKEMAPGDRRIVNDSGIRGRLAESFGAALRDSTAGWIDDAIAFTSPWGFEVSDIRVPVLLWHGADDSFSPPSHSRWLKKMMSKENGAVELEVERGAGHFRALEVMPDKVAWLIPRA
jgi:pimeloyl-ACP methyl ester carboxylesterase